MKKKLLCVPLLILTLLLYGCSSGSDSTPADEISSGSDSSSQSQKGGSPIIPLEPNESETVETQELSSNNDTGTSSEIVDAQDSFENVPTVSNLFETVYLPYANRENNFVFSAVKSFVQSCGYDIEITEPTEEDFGRIQVNDTNGDYVYFSFMPINGIETIMTVSFYQSSSESEVSLSNYSTDGSVKYDTYNTHIIGGSENTVNTVDEQKKFLFN